MYSYMLASYGWYEYLIKNINKTEIFPKKIITSFHNFLFLGLKISTARGLQSPESATDSYLKTTTIKKANHIYYYLYCFQIKQINYKSVSFHNTASTSCFDSSVTTSSANSFSKI